MKKLLWSCLLLSLPILVLGQRSRPVKDFENIFGGPLISGKTAMRFSIIGHEYWQPGLMVGLEDQYHYKFKGKTRKNGKIKWRTRRLLASAEIGYWRHPRAYSALFLRAGTMLRRTYTRGGLMEVGINLGIQQRFNAGKTYVVTQNGGVSQAGWDGRTYFMPSLVGGIGKDFFVAGENRRRMSLHLRSHLNFFLPVNGTWTASSMLELGVGWYILDLNIFKGKSQSS